MKKIFIVVFFLCFLPSLLAETITLKSGKKIEGNIIEETAEYIKVDFSGVPLTYYREEISDIEAEKTEPVQPRSYSSSGQKSDQSWNRWYNQIFPYIKKMKSINQKNKKYIEEVNQKSAEMAQSNNMEKFQALMRKSQEVLSGIINQLKQLQPPAELRLFHEKNIESAQYSKRGIEAILAGDINSASSYGVETVKSGLEAVKQQRRVYKKHGAPREFIEPLDENISILEESLNQNR
ncbi:MAG: hypothetical protein K9L95_03850 [Candidatus Omnitrophica bacterium]|nr:hypothetical protein [Candidatus Omnitrophota bacterium]MCF7878585.1 hypothetical protein [Candidatus Omnitrophota bacterium]MCF7892857.1 hypothetical protein [Candidatus Omnitrophota bacterium]